MDEEQGQALFLSIYDQGIMIKGLIFQANRLWRHLNLCETTLMRNWSRKISKLTGGEGNLRF